MTAAGDLSSGVRAAVIRPLEAADEDEFIRLARASRRSHHPWITAPETTDAFRRYFTKFRTSAAEAFLVCDDGSGGVVGFVNLNEVVGEPFQRGLVGYGTFTPHEGRGYMTEGLRLICEYAFARRRLHRLEADIQPANEASRRVAAKTGFVCECVSPGFIRINGEWKDHERWALTADRWAALRA
jgi:ribosomal-protein-alanine N-acetyltransferase